MKRRLAIILILSLGVVVQAATLTVPLPYSTIQAAINDANNGDTVVVSPGRYYANIDFAGKAITVRSTDPNDPNIVAATIIDGSAPSDANRGSTVTFRNGEGNNSVLAGFTITGGTGSWILVSWEYNGLRWNRCGGGAVCYNMSAPTISKNVFIANTAGQGGGIYVYGDPVNPNDPIDPAIHVSPVIIDNVFMQNQAIIAHGFTPPDNNHPVYDHGDGGAIVCFQGCDGVIKGNYLTDNYAESYGGGLHVRQWSNPRIEDNEIADNDSLLGAGLHITYMSSPTIIANTIRGNTAGSLGGGGIYVYYQSAPLIEWNLITENDCVSGAGVAIYYSSFPEIRNNLIVRNRNGAGIRVRGGSYPHIIHNTIADNTAASYTGGVEYSESAFGTLEDNIVVGSGQGYGIYVDTNGLPSIRYNNVWGNSKGNYGPVMADQTGVNGNISTDPAFLDRDINDYHLNFSSRCINAGDPNFADANQQDYEGNLRKMGQRTDIGAYEAWPVWNLTAGGGYVKIQDAINDSNDGDRLAATVGRYYENINFNGHNIVLESVDPNDPWVVDNTIIDGNSRDTVIVFESGEDTNCVLAGVTITGGKAVGDYGGGLRIRNYSGPTIRNNTISGNSAKKGAGISMYHSFSHVLNNHIYNNRYADAGQGGGMMLIDCFEDSNAVVANNIIVGNSTLYGGGIRIQNSTANIVNNIMAYNRASWKGKGVYAEGDSIENCIVWGHGGAADDDIYQCTASYSCIQSNVAGPTNISADPCIVDWGYWDDRGTPGNTGDDIFVWGNYHIKPLSPCVNAGDNNSVPAAVNIDIDSEPRQFGGRVDIGADELVTNEADFNVDGIVDFPDFSVLADEWLSDNEPLASDFNNDGFVDFADFARLALNWRWLGGWY